MLIGLRYFVRILESSILKAERGVPEAVVLAAQDLGRDVVRGAAEGGGGVTGPDAFLAHAVVGQFDVALVVQQDVVQLEIAVDDACRPRAKVKDTQIFILLAFLFFF